MPEETFGDACQKTGGKIMTKLDCSVTGCMHNAENCCCKNTILVEGKTAQDKCDTCCGSFDEKKGGTFRNLFKTPESRLEVECEATNCVYNTDRRCSAEHRRQCDGFYADGMFEFPETVTLMRFSF